MLDDTPRKLLLIITHYQRHFGSLPGMPELERLSGRTPVPIKEGLSVLARENYIQWQPDMPPERAVIIEGWERDNPSHQADQRGGNTDYWNYY
ncbi:hypothetical protein [Paenibacillus sp. sgz500992]|uniref:hypothetical protein n=1 Tax=Paenibacillus sp. sgz500992 TaxID=3242476 RepID=UPI0036D2C85C